MNTPKARAPSLAAALPGRSHAAGAPMPCAFTSTRHGSRVMSRVIDGVRPAGGSMRLNDTEHAVSTHSCGPGGTVEPVGSGSGSGSAAVVVVTARPRTEKRYTPLVLLFW